MPGTAVEQVGASDLGAVAVEEASSSSYPQATGSSSTWKYGNLPKNRRSAAASGQSDPTENTLPTTNTNINIHQSHNWQDPSLLPSLDRAQSWSTTPSIHISGRHFKDPHNRSLLLRGVNACGNAKLPTHPLSCSSTHILTSPLHAGKKEKDEEFYDHRNVSFVGRPFPVEEADEHFARLRGWGLTMLRLLVPWEALEHGGPGVYDEEYIDYLIKILEKAGEYGIKCFI
ncbi:hypothetical protein HK102_011724, partial [Quaeritorhiza haematococci]